jgi:glycerol-3-phosphate acyltransferase PlsY
MSGVLKRGLFHLFGGLSLAIIGFSLPQMFLVILLSLATFTFLALELVRLKTPAINRRFLALFQPLLREKEAAHLTGASYILIAALISFLVFPKDIAVLSLSFLAVGDAVAGIVGEQVGGRRLFGKTLVGDFACLIACLAVGVIFHYAGLAIPLLAALAGSLSATIMEALPLPIDDNLTIPLFAGIVMTLLVLA